MSSYYRLLCLSHDPAIVIDGDDRSRDTAIARAHAGVPDHVGCDLLIGRYSAPLVEVCCPTRTAPGPTPAWHPGWRWHAQPIWADAALLRLALLAIERADGDEAIGRAIRQLPECWSWTRLRRLAPELDVTLGPSRVNGPGDAPGGR